MKNFISRLLAEGTQTVSVSELGNTIVPQFPDRRWEPDTLLHIPEDAVPFRQELKFPDGGAVQMLFTLVWAEFPDGESLLCKLPFSVFTKVAVPYGGGPRVRARGTAVDLVHRNVSWLDAFCDLKGKTLIVTADHAVDVLFKREDFEEIRTTHIYDLDIR